MSTARGLPKPCSEYSDIHNVDKIAPKGVAPAETIGLFTADKIAFICANIFDYRTFESTEGLRYGFAPFPSFADGVPATPTDSFHIGVSNFSENKAAAAEFVKFFTFGKGNDAFCNARGEFSARVSELQKYFDDPQYENEPLSIFRLAAYEAQNSAAPRPKSLGYREWESVIGATIEDIRNGADVEEALDAAVSSIEVKLVLHTGNGEKGRRREDLSGGGPLFGVPEKPFHESYSIRQY